MRKSLVAACALLLAGCTVGPDYRKPAAPPAAAFKELAGWKPSTPHDEIDRGAWWSVFHDRDLDALEQQVAVSNQNVRAFAAAFRQAQALVWEARSAQLPLIGLTANGQRGVGGTGGFGGGSPTSTTGAVEASASWDLDVWGRIRRQVESQTAAAQVSAADLANATLSAQVALATDYFDLRAQDSLADLLTRTVAEYQHSLQITQNQYDAGTASRADVVTAQAQLQSTQALLVAVGVLRAQYEHAIAVLSGHAPSELTVAPALLTREVPVVPAGVPSALLERRPDIAAAERAMAQQNALIGVAVAAFYPDITLSGLFGYAGNPLSNLFNVANRVWSLGGAASETLFDAGQRTAAVEAARAGYDQSVATYRQTVLSAFQQIEDQLSTLHVLQDQAAAEAAAIDSARHALEVTLNEYRAGTVVYTAVITEQTLLLADEQTALSIAQNRLAASVALIGALGGGWNASDLPASIPAGPLFP